MEACHDEIGHLGVERTKALIKDRFYWSGMNEDITEYIKTCPQCIRFKAVPETTELNPITVTQPMELVHIDYLTIKSKTSEKDVNIMIVTDHFTCYTQVYITHSQTASVVANTL